MRNRRGQAMTELVLLIPLFLMLAGGTMMIVYICWQGVKVQQAANLAARIQGQERVAGGRDISSIANDNGVRGTLAGLSGDPDLTSKDAKGLTDYRQGRTGNHLYYSGVYGKIQKAVRSFFTGNEQAGLSVPAPEYGSQGYSDKVAVQLDIVPPALLGLTIPPQLLIGTAYGGEDTHMYGLVRWGSTGNPNGSQKFWSDPANLPNPNQD